MIGLLSQKEEIFQQAKNQAQDKSEKYNHPIIYPIVNDKLVNLIMMEETDNESNIFKVN